MKRIMIIAGLMLYCSAIHSMQELSPQNAEILLKTPDAEFVKAFTNSRDSDRNSNAPQQYATLLNELNAYDTITTFENGIKEVELYYYLHLRKKNNGTDHLALIRETNANAISTYTSHIQSIKSSIEHGQHVRRMWMRAIPSGVITFLLYQLYTKLPIAP